MRKNVLDQNEYLTYKIEAEKWLDNANKIIEKCNNVQNLDNINDNLNEINVSSHNFPFKIFVKYIFRLDSIKSRTRRREDHQHAARILHKVLSLPSKSQTR